MMQAATLNGSVGNINNKLKAMGVNSQIDHDSMDGSPGKFIFCQDRMRALAELR